MKKSTKTTAEATIKSNLRDIMVNNGIREIDLARATRISQPTISRYRSDVDIPGNKKAKKIVEAINKLTSKSLTINNVWQDYEKQYRANLVNTLKARVKAGRKGGKTKKKVAKK